MTPYWTGFAIGAMLTLTAVAVAVILTGRRG